LFLKICPAYAHFSTSLGWAFDCSTRFERSFSCSGDLGPLLTDRVSIDKLRHIDLNIIISALSEQEELPKPAFWKSMKKQEKIVFAPCAFMSSISRHATYSCGACSDPQMS
jgi:hypothetical protein